MTARFIVKGWNLDDNEISLHYECDGHSLREKLTFPDAVLVSPVVERLLDLLTIVAGVSYAKAFAPTTVAFPSLDVSPSAIDLIEHTYDHGMREFAFENGLPLTSTFLIRDESRLTAHAAPPFNGPQRPLIPFGGGRDSCVVASALRGLDPTLFTVGENPFARRIAATLGLNHLVVRRDIDPALLRLNDGGAPNGHVPVTAINSLVSVIVANATGHTSVVMANEKSASQPTRTVGGTEVNHQYSKSDHYEHLLAAAVHDTGSGVSYLSVLREIPDRAISRAFAQQCTSLHQLFMSCNRAMVRDDARRSSGWCNNCAKCRGVYLSLAPFLSPATMVSIFGVDLLADANQTDGFRALVTDDEKPFECVADVEEARESLWSLTHQKDWSDHAVVRTLAGLGSASTSAHTAAPRHSSLFSREISAFIEGAP